MNVYQFFSQKRRDRKWKLKKINLTKGIMNKVGKFPYWCSFFLASYVYLEYIFFYIFLVPAYFHNFCFHSTAWF